MNKKNLYIGLATLLIGGAIVFFMLKGNEDKVNTVDDIVIGYPTLRIALPVFVAQENGYFKEQGLNITLKDYQTAQPMMDALVSGKIDIGGFCALPITFGAIARSKTDLLFLGGMYEDNEHPISVLIVKDTASIKSVADLKGKRVGILPTRAYEVWLQQILSSNEIDPSNVIIRQVPPNLQADALNSGSVDALFTNDPAATITMSKGFGTRIYDKALVPNATDMTPFYFGSFNIRKDYATKHPQIVARVAKAIDKASKYINSNPETAQLAMKNYLPEQHRKFVESFPISYFKTCNEVSGSDLKKIKDYYFSKQVLPVNINIEGSQYNY